MNGSTLNAQRSASNTQRSAGMGTSGPPRTAPHHRFALQTAPRSTRPASRGGRGCAEPSLACVVRQAASLALIALLALPAAAAREPERALYLDNGAVRLGIDLGSGGSVFHFGPSAGSTNLLNHFDRGRFVQQSYYGSPDGSLWNKKPWRWNPVQGGDWRGSPARLLSCSVSTNGGQAVALVSRSVPKHWASGADIDEAVMEQRITLTNSLAHIRYRFVYTGTAAHPPAHQELPAVFVDGAYTNLVFYGGPRPWTGDTLTRAVPGWPNQGKKTTEHWAAYVNSADFGLGVFTPGTGDLTCYRFEGDRRTGPKGSACSYFAPLRTFAITPGLTFEYDVWLAAGTLADIRARFAAAR